MVNERKTEIIVRERLRELGYFSDDNITVEEQQSDFARIDKLLSSASKKGTGKGYPEFIIRSELDPKLVIVIECKADPKKHESKNHNLFSEYAVDGVLLYAAYLAREFDVIAIAVSGESEQELLIDHYLYLEKSNSYHHYFSNKLLKYEDYQQGYLLSDYKFNQDYNKLIDYTKQLNETLHGKKIKESQRSLLVSGILIALENKAFRASYKSHVKASQLANQLISTITDQFTNSNLPESKIKNLRHAYSFVVTNTTLSTDKDFFELIIEEIDSNINSFMKTHKYFDTLGQFYIEFLRYANNDKGLGIVLTPPHITELFTELAELNTESVVYDNCCGTGGFLISSMKKMLTEANHDQKKIDLIKQQQLIGVEYQDDIYALAVSNMILHGDGKSNILLGDSFELSATVKQEKKPNIGFLNPPYKTKKSDIEELAFVLDNLSALDIGGKCLAIIPLSCALAKSGEVFELKKRLLREHTLEAVMSMPEDLFHNSKVNVVTCILVVTAHKPHPDNKKTWLGYWRDDGFKKTKGQGRIDLNHTWSKTKNEWLSAYMNRETLPKLSLQKKLAAEDEWCAEAYMETDYTEITEDKFVETVKKYLTYRLLHDLTDVELTEGGIFDGDDDCEVVPLSRIFNIYNGLASSKVAVKEEPELTTDIRYIRPSQTYAGSVAGYVDESLVEDNYIYPDNTLYVSTDGQGSHSYSYLSSFRFVPNSNVSVLIPKEEMSIQEKIYYAMCVTLNRYRYSYGRKPKGQRLSSLMVPSKPPAFVYSDVFTSIFNEWKKLVK